MPVVPPAERSDKGIAVPDCMAKIIRFMIQTKLLCKFLCTEIAFLTFPIRNETTSHPIREIFRHICKTRKPPCRERVAFFLLFPSIYSFAEEACPHYLYIYQVPSRWQPFLISSYQFFGGYSHIVPCFVSTSLPPPPTTACSCCCYLYLAYFCPKVINCYSCICHVCRHYGQL